MLFVFIKVWNRLFGPNPSGLVQWHWCNHSTILVPMKWPWTISPESPQTYITFKIYTYYIYIYNRNKTKRVKTGFYPIGQIVFTIVYDTICFNIIESIEYIKWAKKYDFAHSPKRHIQNKYFERMKNTSYSAVPISHSSPVRRSFVSSTSD